MKVNVIKSNNFLLYQYNQNIYYQLLLLFHLKKIFHKQIKNFHMHLLKHIKYLTKYNFNLIKYFLFNFVFTLISRSNISIKFNKIFIIDESLNAKKAH